MHSSLDSELSTGQFASHIQSTTLLANFQELWLKCADLRTKEQNSSHISHHGKGFDPAGVENQEESSPRKAIETVPYHLIVLLELVRMVCQNIKGTGQRRRMTWDVPV